MHPYLVPIVWLAFLVFFIGIAVKLARAYRAARREGSVLPTLSGRHAASSIAHWVTPFASRSMRLHPVLTVMSFAFHLCLLITPLLVMGHIVLFQRHWHVRWWALPPALADAMTLLVVFGGVAFLLRRLAAPEVRNVSTWRDFAIVALVISPFVTGFIARAGWFEQETMMVIHVIAGSLWLMAIPFTRLAHMLWFFLARAYMGSEFGAVRHARDW